MTAPSVVGAAAGAYAASRATLLADAGDLGAAAGSAVGAYAASITQPPPSGMVRLYAETGSQITLIRNGDIDRTGGVGGWQTSESMTGPDGDWFKARTKGAVSVPCLIDIDEITGPSIERRLRTLYEMGREGDADHPPGIFITGDAPHCQGIKWKLDDVALAGNLNRRALPTHLRRIALTLSMSELLLVGQVEQVRIRSTRTAAGARKTRSVTTRQGDTLRSIAVRELGSSSEWITIRDANKHFKHTDPDSPLRAGLRIKLSKPTSSAAAALGGTVGDAAG